MKKKHGVEGRRPSTDRARLWPSIGNGVRNLFGFLLRLFKMFLKRFDARASILFLPVATVMLFDLAFTLSGQPRAYWQLVFNDFWSFSYQGPNESNLIGRVLLELHPLIFLGIYTAYGFLIYCSLIYRNHFIRLSVFLAAMIGHSAGAGSWIVSSREDTMGLGRYLLRNFPSELPISESEAYFIVALCFYLAMTIIGASVLWVYWQIHIVEKEEDKSTKSQ